MLQKTHANHHGYDAIFPSHNYFSFEKYPQKKCMINKNRFQFWPVEPCVPTREKQNLFKTSMCTHGGTTDDINLVPNGRARAFRIHAHRTHTCTITPKMVCYCPKSAIPIRRRRSRRYGGAKSAMERHCLLATDCHHCSLCA